MHRVGLAPHSGATAQPRRQRHTAGECRRIDKITDTEPQGTGGGIESYGHTHYVWQGWKTHVVRSIPTLLRNARMQALQICVRLSTAQSTLLRATQEFFSHVTHFFLARIIHESQTRSWDPLHNVL